MKKNFCVSSLVAGFLLLALPASTSLQYIPDAGGASISLEDEATRITGIKTIFIGDSTLVTLEGVEWSPTEDASNSSSTMMWETSVNGIVQDSGTIEIPSDPFDLPSSINAGSFVVDKSKYQQKDITRIYLYFHSSTLSLLNLKFTSTQNNFLQFPLRSF